MGKRMLRYDVCDLCRTEKVESAYDNKGNNVEYDTGITKWTLPVVVRGNEKFIENSIEDRDIDVCDSCLDKIASVEWGIINHVENYRIRNEG